MKLIIQRANQDFGPYPLAFVEQYIAQGRRTGLGQFATRQAASAVQWS
jgi:hypothetical protein